ncbi:hypothetical protein Agabi119p4_8708 [Agaricus bisporus var. burnettii]|uniref:Uncharacterized protein n=1 Tax=Agaricus bisporus var. burnettii TaxID=192524 RepID=A0A8H7EXY4_AGABI|nr:hypothetical protein Agabi119p4_8708 [Agaricus bisporus var. burnettii]
MGHPSQKRARNFKHQAPARTYCGHKPNMLNNCKAQARVRAQVNLMRAEKRSPTKDIVLIISTMIKWQFYWLKTNFSEYIDTI